MVSDCADRKLQILWSLRYSKSSGYHFSLRTPVNQLTPFNLMVYYQTIRLSQKHTPYLSLLTHVNEVFNIFYLYWNHNLHILLLCKLLLKVVQSPNNCGGEVYWKCCDIVRARPYCSKHWRISLMHDHNVKSGNKKQSHTSGRRHTLNKSWENGDKLRTFKCRCSLK